MLNVDIGGAKNRNTQEGKWKIFDIAKSADFVVDLNSGARFPFGDGEVNNYYMSHTLEHVLPEYVVHVLAEMHRTLVVGGRGRIIVPDVAFAVRLYCETPGKLWGSKVFPTIPAYYPKTPLGALLAWIVTPDKGDKSGHKMAFDLTTLYWCLVEAGFVSESISCLSFGKCSAVFEGKDMERYKEFSLYVEAQKNGAC